MVIKQILLLMVCYHISINNENNNSMGLSGEFCYPFYDNIKVPGSKMSENFLW